MNDNNTLTELYIKKERISMKKVILIFSFIFLMSTNYVNAEKFLIEADGYHTVSRKETIEFAEDAAVDNALKWAVEQIGVRISAYSEVVNKVLREDTVQRFASAVIQIKEKTLTPRVMGDDYRIYAHVICIVDTADLDKWEPPDIERQRKLEEDKARLEEQNKQLAKERDNANQQLGDLQKAVAAGDNGTPGWDYLETGDNAYLKGDVQKATNCWMKAWKKGNTSRASYGVPERALYRLAIYCWNRGSYQGFVNWMHEVPKVQGRGIMYRELYSHWIYPDTYKPRHNKKIDLTQMIKDKEYLACITGSKWQKYFK